jgi:hypothetical protein
MVIWRRRVGGEEVIAAWLKHEYQSRTDFKAMVDRKIPRDVGAITNPDLGNPSQNQVRLGILTQYRPFVLAIAKADWWVAEIDRADFAGLKLIDSGDWRFITDGTLDPTRAAEKIDKDVSLRTGIYANQVNFILNGHQELASGSSRITLVGVSKEGPFTVVDGVHRAVSMALYYIVRSQEPFAKREAYVGLTGAPFSIRFA